MTEDMRERFEKWFSEQFGYMPVWYEAGSVYVGRASSLWMPWQAALSSAGTSGTAAVIHDEELLEILNEEMANAGIRMHYRFTREPILAAMRRAAMLRGDSLSGKGAATKPTPIVSLPEPPDEALEALRKQQREDIAKVFAVPGAPDRAEELARDKFAELRSFLTNMRRDAADAEDPELSEYAQAIEQRLDELASLLREAEGRCPTCGLTIVPRLCANPACASSVRR